jgi:lipopolysaccharide export system protein LptC
MDCIMKLKLNQVILVLAILVVVSWNIMRSRRIEKLEDVTTASDVVLYVQSRDEPNPFITHDLAKKLTNDDAKLEKVLQLASEKKKIELLEFVKTL